MRLHSLCTILFSILKEVILCILNDPVIYLYIIKKDEIIVAVAHAGIDEELAELLAEYEGNKIKGLIKVFKRAKNNNAPLIIHLITRKGQGYKPAEDNMTDFHGIDTALKNHAAIQNFALGIQAQQEERRIRCFL